MEYQNVIVMFIETLQILACLRMFSDSYLRRKWYVLGIAFVIAIIDTLQQFYVGGYVSTFVIDVVCILVCLRLMTKRKWKELAFEFLMAFVFVGVSQLFTIWLFFEITGIAVSERLLSIISTLLLLCILFFSGRPKIKYGFRMFYEKTEPILHLIFANLFVIPFMELYLWNTNRPIFYQEMGFVVIALILWGLMNLLLLVELLDNRKQKELLQIHENHIDVVEALLDELHGEKHEFRKHLQTIMGLIEGKVDIEELQEVREYMDNLSCKDTESGEKRNPTYLTGNRVINALLYMKQKEAKESGISLMYVPGEDVSEFPCEEYELTEVVGNLITNAFEAVQTMAETERKVLLRIDMVDGKVEITVKNFVLNTQEASCEKLVKKGYSTKNGARRGYGLHRVRQIVEKYNGSLSLFQEGNYFIAQVLF